MDRGDIKTEFMRKCFHLGILLYIPAYLILGYPGILPWACAWTALVAAIETARLYHAPTRALIQMVFGSIIRDKEEKRYTGTFYSIIGLFLTLLFFGAQPRLACSAILYLALGDAASALVGKAFGRLRFRILGASRSLEGCLAGALTALACGLAAGLPPPLAIVGAATFSLIDTVPIPPDDNLWIPLITAFSLKAFGA